MKCEVEFLAVGEGTKPGDAIIIRYGEPDNYRLMLVDGGYTETGEKIVEHLRRRFGPNPVLQDVLLTHSDGDHASGLRVVLDKIQVFNLHLHIPWLLADESRNLNLFRDKRWTRDGLRANLQGQYDIVSGIFDMASTRGCKMFYPFADGAAQVGPFKILSPTREAYRYLLPQFDKTPDPDQAAIEAAGLWIGKESLAAKLFQAARSTAHTWTEEVWAYERLRDGGITNASNESSVVLYGSFEKGNVLLTGDAGVRGLTWAANMADYLGLPLQRFSFVQIPHHGSRRNIGPTILTRLVGNKQLETDPTRLTAFVSAPKDDEEHPKKMVLNAFKRRGGFVNATQGENIVYYGGFPERRDYHPLQALPFFTRVEDYA